MLNQQIEFIALNSWPAFRQLLYDGWLLRFTDGFTKRANSINPLFPSTLNIQQKIDFCENIYHKNSLPPIFRITSFSPDNQLDLLLAEKKYQHADVTQVLYLHLDHNSHQPSPVTRFFPVEPEQWLGCFAECSETTITDHQIHRQILANIVTTPCFGILKVNRKAVACGLGVLERETIGLFDLITHPQYRRRGYGKILVSRLLEWGHQLGAVHAYLQVEEKNHPARRLYSGFGFYRLYHYWYRVLKNENKN